MSYNLGMDTIIFFYQKKSPAQRDISLMYQEDYLFAKVGVCADRNSWFGCPLPQPLQEEPGDTGLPQGKPEAGACGGATFPPQGESDIAGLPQEEPEAGVCETVFPSRATDGAKGKGGGWFQRYRQKRARQRELRRRQQEYMQQMQEYEERRLELADSIRRLKEEVFSEVARAGGMGTVRCVYESSLRFLADAQGRALSEASGNGSSGIQSGAQSGDPGEARKQVQGIGLDRASDRAACEAALCWSRVWDIPEFRDYKSMRWVQPLLEYVRHSDFILLGRADCIPVILQRLARQMKSLQWYLREEDLDEEVQGWVEDFYEESGLAVALRSRTGRDAFRQLRFHAAKPVCVMDFTEEEKFFAEDLPGDSVWLDFASVDGKGGRMSRRAPGVAYMSLKKYWGAKTKAKPIIPKEHAASRFRLP